MRCVVLHRAGDDVSRFQFGRDSLRRELRSAVPPDGRSGDYPKSGGHHASKLRDYLLRQSPAQIRLCRVSVQVIERQNGDQRRVARCAEDEPPGGQQRATPADRRAGGDAIRGVKPADLSRRMVRVAGRGRFG